MTAPRENAAAGGTWRWAAEIAAALMAALVLAVAAFGLLREPAPGAAADFPAPVRSETYTWGSFDELRMSRYYGLEDVPDGSRIPRYVPEDPDGPYELVEVNGPVDTGSGPCWEAVYRIPK